VWVLGAVSVVRLGVEVEWGSSVAGVFFLFEVVVERLTILLCKSRIF